MSSTSSIEALLGGKLLSKDGETSTASLSKKKLIVLYFSAHWCPPCRRFTPLLSKAYEEYKESTVEEDRETDIVFCSWDRDAKSFAEYHEEMSFPAIPFDKKLAKELGEKYNVEGIPTMIAIDPTNGEDVYRGDESIDLRNLIVKHGASALPLTRRRMEELKAEEDTKIRKTLAELENESIPFMVKASEDGKDVSLVKLLGVNEYIGLYFGDGDANDSLNARLVDTMNTVNEGHSDRFKMIYVGWSLYDDSSDHSKLSPKFPYSVDEPSDSVRRALTILARGNPTAPSISLLRLGKGLCNLDGTCEPDGIHLLDANLRRLATTGPSAFPWDQAAMTKHEEEKNLRIQNLKSKLKNFEFLRASGDKPSPLISGGSPINVDDMLKSVGDDGVIGVYFSAHWCPPCQMFTPMLVQCYEDVNAAKKKFEIIFVSSDRDKGAFEDYYKSMTTTKGHQFLALDFDQSDLKKDLGEIMDTKGIPHLVLLKKDGTIITKDGREAIVAGADCFPWDTESLQFSRTN